MSVAARSSGASQARWRGRRPLQGGAQPRVVDGGADQLGAGRREGQDLGQQPVQVQHLDAAVAQRLGEGVVLLLRAGHPRDAVEEQLVVVARGEPPQLGAGPVQQHRAQAAHLAGRAHRAASGRDHGQRLAQRPARAPAGASGARWIVCRYGGRQRSREPDDGGAPWTCST